MMIIMMMIMMMMMMTMTVGAPLYFCIQPLRLQLPGQAVEAGKPASLLSGHYHHHEDEDDHDHDHDHEDEDDHDYEDGHHHDHDDDNDGDACSLCKNINKMQSHCLHCKLQQKSI